MQARCLCKGKWFSMTDIQSTNINATGIRVLPSFGTHTGYKVQWAVCIPCMTETQVQWECKARQTGYVCLRRGSYDITSSISPCYPHGSRVLASCFEPFEPFSWRWHHRHQPQKPETCTSHDVVRCVHRATVQVKVSAMASWTVPTLITVLVLSGTCRSTRVRARVSSHDVQKRWAVEDPQKGD